MLLLLGATGYIGQAFQTELNRRGERFVALSRSQVDYTRFTPLYEYLKANRPSFVINAAGYTGKPNVDACEAAKADTLQGTRFSRRLWQTHALHSISPLVMCPRAASLRGRGSITAMAGWSRRT
jgi:NAD dependent epimerase/dehydratase family enzyme